MTGLLPLFPLHSVLFPGMPLRLRIFEPRYRQMLEACLAGDQSFGVVLIKHGQEAYGPPPVPYGTGVRASIQRVEPLEDGQIGLLAVGDERFRILSLVEQQPYLLANVAYSRPRPATGVEQHAACVRERLQRYLALLEVGGSAAVRPIPIADDPLALAYQACSLMQLPLTEKQALLEMDALGDLLLVVQKLLARELALEPAIRAGTPAGNVGGFSLN